MLHTVLKILLYIWPHISLFNLVPRFSVLPLAVYGLIGENPGNEVILRVSETIFLGVFLDDNLTWKPHISLLASKLSKSIGIIHKSRFFLSTQSFPTLYNSMILPYLYYCNLTWGGTYKANLQRIVILQKRALRIVNNSTYDANTSPIFKELTLLKFHDTHSFQLGFLCFHSRTLHSLPNSITSS